MNSLTSFVDASQVYGSDNHRGSYLREKEGGRLRRNTTDEKFLPSVASIAAEINDDIEIEGTYAAGDERVNEMPGLTTLHTRKSTLIWMNGCTRKEHLFSLI